MTRRAPSGDGSRGTPLPRHPSGTRDDVAALYESRERRKMSSDELFVLDPRLGRDSDSDSPAGSRWDAAMKALLDREV